ncbi:MAG TPA: site-specific integrase, partial [bacterium]|nr:site-specific integrase [bacterium]
EKQIIKKLKEYFKNVPLITITQEKIERYLSLQNLSSGSYNRELAVIRFMFKKAVEWNYLVINPVLNIKRLRQQQKPVRYLTDEEINKILSVCNEEERDIFIFFLNTGLRLSEFYNLKWSDISLEKDLITIQKTKSYKVRYIPISKELKEILLKWKKQNREKICLYSKEHINKKIRIISRKAGVSGVSTHILRHTFASRLVMKGVPIRVVQELLGHSDIRMTMIYSHLAPDYLEQVKKVLNS